MQRKSQLLVVGFAICHVSISSHYETVESSVGGFPFQNKSHPFLQPCVIHRAPGTRNYVLKILGTVSQELNLITVFKPDDTMAISEISSIHTEPDLYSDCAMLRQ